jgi:hypothetical protein
LLASGRIQDQDQNQNQKINFLEDVDRNVYPGVDRAAHIVAAVNVVHVNLVRVAPARRQRMPDGEPISAVLEARTPFNDYRPDDDKAVLTSKVRMPMVI